MSWAAQRRLFILLILGAVILAFVAVVAIAALYETPSCSDGVQNQGETGVDCGGSCAYLCTAAQEPPTVLFTQALSSAAGRVDIIASVENKNAGAAAKNIPYRISLFDARQTLIKEVSGTLDLPPGATVPVFVPGVASGGQEVATAFLSIAPGAPKWYALAAGARSVPIVSSAKQGGTLSAPRVEAVLTNPTTSPINGVRAIVMVRGKEGNVIAASETLISSIPAEGQATAIFTWNEAFGDTPAAIEVAPIVPLP